MCMDEFVKRLYDFWVFIEFFGVKIIITYIYRYFTDIYRHLSIFTDIYRYFTDIFSEIPAQACVLHSHDFSVEKSVFSDFFVEKSAILPIFPLIDFSSDRFFLCFFFSMPTENRFFGDISVEKTDFFCPWS